ncbi:helix-turn-helix domain-containing protein [Kitasatospora sp. NPDC098652]|uniref:helix-turn-helix domain-containing protein n=1 Tax=Kitasatospora sp. NPDC098652 TaxID=3364095 RepID=UPI003814066D
MITGYLLKVIREQIPLTQEELAGRLGLDKSTVQGWESGRRPLSATRAGNLVALRLRLIRLGAPVALVDLLDTAMEADLLLSQILHTRPDSQSLGEHPLAAWVLNRDTTHMLGWAISGVLPGAVAAHLNIPAARRGPVSASPLLGADIRSLFFGNLRETSDAAERSTSGTALLRRQAWYLSAYDDTWDAADWFTGMRRRGTMTAQVIGWSSQWAEARSVAASLARQGDPALMRDFIDRSMADHDEAEAANLNYWAHWLGLDTRTHVDDTFMAHRGRPSWSSGSLLRAFAERLDRAFEYTDLYIHSIWALTIAHRGVFEADPHAARELSAAAQLLLDGNTLSVRSRRELESVHYGLRVGGYCKAPD